MPYHCVAYGCGKTSEDGVTLYKFPKDPEEFRKWEKQVQRTRVHWVATPNSYLCSEHFGKEYFEPKSATGALKLRPGAAPTVFVRPHCPSCSGAGCVKCLPAIQRRGITAAPKEHTVSFRSERLQTGAHSEWSLCIQLLFLSCSLQTGKNEVLPPQLNDRKGEEHEDRVQREVKQSGKKSREDQPGEIYLNGLSS